MLKRTVTALVCFVILNSSIFAEMTYFAYNGKLDTVVQTGKGKEVGNGTVDEISSMGNEKFGGTWNIEFSGVMNVPKTGG